MTDTPVHVFLKFCVFGCNIGGYIRSKAVKYCLKASLKYKEACRGMLCGEILRSPQQCLSLPLLPGGPGGVNSPYLALLAMATLTAMDADNDDIFLENGLLSYENPNYHLLHEDQLNSNTEEDLLYYEHLYAELSQRAQQGVTPGQDDAAARRNYKNLDIGSMGVD
ncbi:hypothetical protein FOCC_FOCC005449, partial [Frankliniella occidentalis]